jgi:DNA-binding beta-propeller fold protein YncE
MREMFYSGVFPMGPAVDANTSGPRLRYMSQHVLGGGYRGQMFHHPSSATMLPADGDLVVADSWNHRLQFFSPHGRIRQTFGSFGVKPGEFWQPRGLAANNYSVFVVDTGNHRVQKLRLVNMTVSRVIGTYGRGIYQFRFPVGAVLLNGTLYVSDSNNHRVSMFWSLALKSKGTFGRRGVEPGQLSHPEGIAGYNGELYVVDSGNDRISVFNLAGRFLRTFGGEGDAPGRFMLPTGIIAFQSRLYVTEFYGKRVQELTTSGEPLQTVPMGDVGGLAGLCADEWNTGALQLPHLYIVDAEYHVVHVLAVGNGQSNSKHSSSRARLQHESSRESSHSRLQSFLDGIVAPLKRHKSHHGSNAHTSKGVG